VAPQEERLFVRRPASCRGALHASTAEGVQQSESTSRGPQKHHSLCAVLEWPQPSAAVAALKSTHVQTRSTRRPERAHSGAATDSEMRGEQMRREEWMHENQ
jgi:hypothetical protein